MLSRSYILGIDIGSVAVSVVALRADKHIIQSAYDFHHGNTADKLKELPGSFSSMPWGLKPSPAAAAGRPSKTASGLPALNSAPL